MKAYLVSICVFFQACIGFGQGSLYTFSGTVSSLVYDGGGILAAHNVAIGDPVSASYFVDFGAPGYYLLNDGTVNVPTDPPLGNVHTTYFYCRWASGTLLPSTNGGFNNRPQDIAKYFTAWNQSSPSGNEGWLQGGTGNSNFSVRKSSFGSGSQVQEWHVGTEVRGIIVAWSDQDWSIAWADMRLDSITAVEPTQQIEVSMRDLGDGNIGVGAIGCTPSSQVVFQYSIDCLNWTAVATNIATLSTTCIFTVPKTNSAAFFRVHQQ